VTLRQISRWRKPLEALQRAARDTGADALLLIDADTQLVGGFLMRAREVLAHDHRVGGVTPAIESESGNLLEAPLGVSAGSTPQPAALHLRSLLRVSALRAAPPLDSTERLAKCLADAGFWICADPFPGLIAKQSRTKALAQRAIQAVKRLIAPAE
jgi:hypothetical protein